MKRVLITAIVSLIVALALAFFGGNAEDLATQASARSEARDAAVPSASPAHTTTTAAARSAPREGRPLVPGPGAPPPGGVLDGGSGASALEQIQAAHAIASQIDVSAYFEKNAELAAKHVERMCAEAKKLPSKPFFSSGSGGGDAGAFLAPRIDWETKPPVQGSLHLPDPLRAQLSADDWDDRLFEIDPTPYDASWMRELLAFDRWELTSAGPPSLLPPGADFGTALPHYLFFIEWSKLRFAQALRAGDYAAASREVRHVADLLHQQGVVIGNVIGILIFRIERRVYDALIRRGVSPVDWEPFAAEDIELLRRLDRSSYAFFLPGVSPKVMSRALECVPSSCVALTEGAWSHAAVGELSSEDTRQSFLEVLKGSGCRSILLDKLTAGQTLTLHEAHATYEGESPLAKDYGP